MIATSNMDCDSAGRADAGRQDIKYVYTRDGGGLPVIQ
jgi:hypothetical protein